MKSLSGNEIKKIELEILVSLSTFCKQNNIYYTLAGGTLLGAIRHKGFIPWDDDVDIVLPRKEYDKFLELTKINKIANQIEVIRPGDKDYYLPYAKVCDTKTVIDENGNLTNHGIWIDVFPLDNFPNNTVITKLWLYKSRILRAIIISMTSNLHNKNFSFKTISKSFFSVIANIVGKNKIVQKANKNARIFNSTKSKFIGGALWGYGIGERMKEEAYLKPEIVKFEGYNFNAPSCWDEYLKGLYGDYLVLPDEDKRKTHSVKAWYRE